MSLGSYATSHEAALAYNHAARLVLGECVPVNVVPADQLPSPERQAAIREAAEAQVRAKRPQPDTAPHPGADDQGPPA